MNLSGGSRVLLCCFLSIVKDTFGQMKPSNAVAEVGGEAIFNCSVTFVAPHWFMSKDGTNANQMLIAGSCNVDINLQNHYKTEQIGGATYCNLVVFDITMEQAGVYWCTESVNSYALLTVIDKSPATTYNATQGVVVENEKVIITCTLHHNGSFAPAPTLRPYFYWTNYVGQNVSSFYDSTTENAAVSQITVVASRQDITPYTCHVYLQLIPPTNPNYAINTPSFDNSSSSPTITVLYFPGNISITSSVSAEYNCVYKQESLTCTADANPPAQYEWLDLNSNTVTSGSVKYITSGGRYQCTAYNDIRSQRHNETKTATETNCYPVKQGNITISGLSCTKGTCYCIGDQTVTLTCVAYSIPGPTYQWWSDVPEHTNLGSSKTIQAAYDGNYSCRATNKYGEVINNGTVSVIVSNCTMPPTTLSTTRSTTSTITAWKTSTTSSVSTSAFPVTDTTTLSSTLNNIAAIVMGVLFGISLAVNLTILIIWLCKYFRANKGKDNVPEPEMRYEEIRRPAEANMQQATYEELRQTPPLYVNQLPKNQNQTT